MRSIDGLRKTSLTWSRCLFFFLARMILKKSASSRSKRRRVKPHQTREPVVSQDLLCRGDRVTSAREVLSLRRRAASNAAPSMLAALFLADPSRLNRKTRVVSMANCAPRQSVSPSAHNLESSSVECVEVAQVHVANKHVGRDPCPCFATHLCSSAFQSTPSAFPRPLPHGTPRDDGQKNQVGCHIGRSARKGEGKTGDDDRAGSGTAVPRSLSFWRSGGGSKRPTLGSQHKARRGSSNVGHTSSWMNFCYT